LREKPKASNSHYELGAHDLGQGKLEWTAVKSETLPRDIGVDR